MSFFAVLKGEASDAGVCAVDLCHLNFWALRGLTRASQFRFDVGIKLTAITATREVGLALPFQVAQIADLHQLMLDKKIADLIWGEPVGLDVPPVADPPTVRFQDGRGEIRLRRVSVSKSVITNQRERSGAICSLSLAEPLLPEESGYYRIRFVVTDVGGTWVWKRSGLGVNGALVDFRVSDPRETWNVNLDQDLEARILDLPVLQLFVIAPWSLQMRNVSPELRYARVLEGRGWSAYVGRPTTLRRRSKLVVYYWKWPQRFTSVDRRLDERFASLESDLRELRAALGAKSGEAPPIETDKDLEPEVEKGAGDMTASSNEAPVTLPQPARAFLDLQRDPGLLPAGNFIRIGAVIAVASAVTAALLGHKFWRGWGDDFGWLGDVKAFIGLGTLGGVVLVVSLVGVLRRWATAAWRVVRRGVEESFIAVVGRLSGRG
jgi:hypothetical protein